MLWTSQEYTEKDDASSQILIEYVYDYLKLNGLTFRLICNFC